MRVIDPVCDSSCPGPARSSAEETASRLTARLRALPPPLWVRPEIRAMAYGLLGTGGLGWLSPEERDRWRRNYAHYYGRNRRLLALLERAAAAAEAAGVRLVALKGAALLPLWYADPGLRPMADLDLLCSPASLGVVRATLEALGLRQQAHEHFREARGIVHDTLLLTPEGDTIELHFALWHELGLPRDGAFVLERARRAPTIAGPLWVPDAGDHLYVVLVHAAIHGFAGNPAWLFDACLLLEEPGALGRASELAVRHGARLPLEAALDHLRAIWPDVVASRPRWPAPLRRAVLRRLAPWLQRGDAALRLWPSRVARPLLLSPTRAARWSLDKVRNRVDEARRKGTKHAAESAVS